MRHFGCCQTPEAAALGGVDGLSQAWPRWMPLTSAQISAARALIRWSAQQLADASAVGVTTRRSNCCALAAAIVAAPNSKGYY
jgi:hypothetical protein